MCSSTPLIVTLAQARVGGLTPVQEAILAHLKTLNPGTIITQAKRFRAYVAGNCKTIPTTTAAARTLAHALRVGASLNCLHPDTDVAAHWLAVRERGGVPMSTYAWLSDDGMPEFAQSLSLRTDKRRHRLAKLPEGWLRDSLDCSRQCNDLLRAGIIVIALSGCRPEEVALTQVQPDETGILLTIKCGKDSPGNPNAIPRYRSLYFIFFGSSMGEHVLVLGKLLSTLPCPFPFNGLSAKSIENGISRTSELLLKRTTHSLTASCYRNQLAADLKRDGVEEQQISYIMGHTSLRTKSKYGTYQQGKPGRRSYLSVSETFRGFTNCGAISLTVCPSACSLRAH